MATILRQIPEHCTKGGATRLAERIRAYWARQGYNVKVWTEPTAEQLWSVRSDMINGRPRSYVHALRRV